MLVKLAEEVQLIASRGYLRIRNQTIQQILHHRLKVLRVLSRRRLPRIVPEQEPQLPLQIITEVVLNELEHLNGNLIGGSSLAEQEEERPEVVHGELALVDGAKVFEDDICEHLDGFVIGQAGEDYVALLGLGL